MTLTRKDVTPYARPSAGDYPDAVTVCVNRQLLSQLFAEQISESDRAVLNACAAIPDVTLSKWACSPGHHWEPLRLALKATRLLEGFDVDADIDGFDEQGNLRSRRQQVPSPPDYRTTEKT